MMVNLLQEIKEFREENKEYKEQLEKLTNDLANCRLCSVSVIEHVSDLIRHEFRPSQEIILKIPKNTNVLNPSDKDLEIYVRRAELKLAGALPENNIPISFMDIMVP